MIKFFKKLHWLIKHQEEIEKCLGKPNMNKNYSLMGVPEYQKDYINDILETEKH